jgi:hypothetical protein
MPVQLPLLSLPGSPTNGVTEVQLLTPTPTISGGYFTLTFDGETTAHIAWNATIPQIEAAIEALDNIGDGNIECTGDDPETPTQLSAGGVVTMTFAGTLAGLPQPEMTADATNLTGSGHDLAVTTDTGGVRGSYRGAPGGTLLQDTDGGALYENTGTATVPVWADFSNVGA